MAPSQRVDFPVLSRPHCRARALSLEARRPVAKLGGRGGLIVFEDNRLYGRSSEQRWLWTVFPLNLDEQTYWRVGH